MSEDVARDFVAAGLDVRVETRDRLVVLIPRGAGADLTSPTRRRAVVALAAARGFSHVALELVD